MEEKFPFPFPPYPIQQQLMTKIYNCICNSNMGLFESPTGTGKSLSVICSTMYWLRQKEAEILGVQLAEKTKAQTVAAPAEDDWLAAFDSSYKQRTANKANEVKFKALDDYDTLKKRLVNLSSDNQPPKIKYTTSNSFGVSDSYTKSLSTAEALEQESISISRSSQADQEWEEFALEDRGANREDAESESDSDSDEEKVPKNKREEFNIDALELPQIIYCSRTHSQIAQFMNEIKKTEFRDLRCIVVGSRKILCVNPQVNLTNSSSSDALLNEKCIEMQKSKATAGKTVEISTADAPASVVAGKRKVGLALGGARTATATAGPCRFLNRAKMDVCSDLSLTAIRDIEEIVEQAKAHQSCPYYSSRTAVQTGAPQVRSQHYTPLLFDRFLRHVDVFLISTCTCTCTGVVRTLQHAVAQRHSRVDGYQTAQEHGHHC